MNFNQLKAIANECVFSMEGITIMKTEEYDYRLKQIEELTNNWNELRQYIKEYLEEWENSDDEWIKGKCDMASDILYDMEEIKEKYK